MKLQTMHLDNCKNTFCFDIKCKKMSYHLAHFQMQNFWSGHCADEKRTTSFKSQLKRVQLLWEIGLYMEMGVLNLSAGRVEWSTGFSAAAYCLRNVPGMSL